MNLPFYASNGQRTESDLPFSSNFHDIIASLKRPTQVDFSCGVVSVQDIAHTRSIGCIVQATRCMILQIDFCVIAL